MTNRLFAAFCCAWLVAAHAGSSVNYTNNPESINSGGGTASAASNTIRATVGQPALAASSSATYSLKSGLWHMGPGASLVPASVVQHTVTPIAGLHGSISPNTPQLIDHNTQAAFTVTPDAGYVATVGGTCGGFLVNNTFTTGAITQDCTVSATFVALVTYNVVLEGWQQSPYAVTPATGSGTAVYNAVAHTLKLNLTYSGLGSAETGAHLHGPALRGANAAVRVPLNLGSPKTDEITLFPVEETMLANGELYVNIHTTNFPDGELRGQVDNVGATALRALTLTKTGAGTGTITGATEIGTVLTCTTDCDVPISKSVNIPNGKSVTLTAAATGGATFRGWEGPCASFGTGTCTLTMDAAKSVAARFDPPSTPASADMSPSQSVAATGATGRDLIVTATAINNGPADATGVQVRYFVPAGASYVWSSPGCTPSVSLVVCAVGNVAATVSASVKIVIRPTAAGTLDSAFSVQATQSDPNSTNNVSVVSVNVAASPPGTPIQRYRLYSDVTKEHHFTTDLNEYNVLGTYIGTWVQEGTVGKILNNPGPFGGVESIPYYRLYDNNTRWHHWTTDANEYYTLGFVYSGWNMEGVDGWILPSLAPGTTELYRLNYPALGALHHWTIDANEYTTLITSFGWVGEPGAGFVVQ